jgi:glycerol-3-phosphate cytidylyltransferase-like family protein
MLETMSRVVKVIKGRKYVYDVKWDSERKKQIWIYKGKVGAKKKKEFDKEKFKRDLYHTIKNDRILKISKQNLKRIRNLIDKTLDNL